MSSILDALGKLESPSPEGPGGPPPKPPRRGLLIAALAVAFVAGIVVMRLAGNRGARTDSPAAVAPPSAGGPSPRPVARLIEPAPVLATREAPSAKPSAPAPRGPATTVPVFRTKPIPSTAPQSAPTLPRPVTTLPRPATTLAPPTTLPRPATTLPPPTTVPPPATTPPTTAPAPSRPAPALSPRPDGAPDVRVSFLMYSADPARRSVALTVDGGGTATLREGEYFQAVRVLAIRPNAVDLEWAGVRYRVPAAR
jgi:hypothetical protein